MTSGRDYVVLSDDWNGLPTSSIHLFRCLSAGNRVFWFNTVGRLPKLNRRDACKVWATARGLFTGKQNRSRRDGNLRHDQTNPGNPYLTTPFMIPWFKAPVRRFNRSSLLATYGKLRSRFAICDPIVVTTFPYTVDFVRSVEGTKLYYCVDEFLDYPGVAHADWSVMEAELVRSIDGLAVTAKGLARKGIAGCPVLHLPHGVEFDHFQDAEKRFPAVPELEAMQRPIVGFFGLLSSWVDLGVIAHLARSFSDVSFVLIGRSEVPLDAITGLPNVHYLGPVPYAELPRYARYFDVGLIPFVLNDLTRAVNPLKLMEYWALGLSVISTRLPELESLEGPMRLAVTPEEFQHELGHLLSGDYQSFREQACAIGRRNTWECRASRLGEFVGEIEASKGRRQARTRATQQETGR